MGDQIIIGADMNMDLESDQLDEFLDALEFREEILHQHGPGGLNTRLRVSKKIDALLVSWTLIVTACGCLPELNCIGDHLILWADITYVSALGHIEPRIPTKMARRLQLHDPRIVDRYLKVLKKEVSAANLPTVVSNMFTEVKLNPTSVDADRFNWILAELHQAMSKAEAK